jgi:phosphate transport system substrate-binding protein
MKNKRSCYQRIACCLPPTACGLLMMACALFSSCSNYFKNDYDDNSPTSGKLKVYYDAGLELHVKNQTFTFEALYPNASVTLFPSSENEAVQALFNDSCEDIVISRLLNDQEKRAFGSKSYSPKYSAVAKSGIALITNINTPIKQLTFENVLALLTQPFSIKDSAGNEIKLTVLFDKKNSSVLHYATDSLLKGKKLSASCNILNSSLESINYVAQNKNTIALVDFAWLSDVDDSIYKANKTKIKFIAVSKPRSTNFYYPDQSNFKLGNYPFTRTIYVIRKTGDFTLAKGFESFMAGPKGQLIFLKQGLLPARQGERAIQVKMGPINEKKD